MPQRKTGKIDLTNQPRRQVPNGHKIRLTHFSETKEEDRKVLKTFRPLTSELAPRYVTIAELISPSGVAIASATSYCNPKDTPNRKLGNHIAAQRCLKTFYNTPHQQGA